MEMHHFQFQKLCFQFKVNKSPTEAPNPIFYLFLSETFELKKHKQGFYFAHFI